MTAPFEPLSSPPCRWPADTSLLAITTTLIVSNASLPNPQLHDAGQRPQGALDFGEVGAPRNDGAPSFQPDAPLEKATAEQHQWFRGMGSQAVGAELHLAVWFVAVEPAVELAGPLAADEGPVGAGRALVEVVDGSG